MSYEYKGNSTPTEQSSLAGGVSAGAEKLRQAKKAELQKKYRTVSVILVCIIVVAVVMLLVQCNSGPPEQLEWYDDYATDEFYNIEEQGDLIPTSSEKMLSQMTKYVDGDLAEVHSYSYDDNQRLAAINVEYLYDPEYPSHDFGRFTYDNDGRLILENWSDPENILYSDNEYEYNAAGQLVCHKEYWYGSELPSYQYNYEYDENGYLQTETLFFPDDDYETLQPRYVYAYTYTYDEQNDNGENQEYEYIIEDEYGSYLRSDHVTVTQYSYDYDGNTESVEEVSLPERIYISQGHPDLEWWFEINSCDYPCFDACVDEYGTSLALSAAKRHEPWVVAYSLTQIELDEDGYIIRAATDDESCVYEFLYADEHEAQSGRMNDPAAVIELTWDGRYDSGDLMELDVSLQGTLDNGHRITICPDRYYITDANGNMIEYYDKQVYDGDSLVASVEMDYWKPGVIIINLYQLDGIYELTVDGDRDRYLEEYGINVNNIVSETGVKADVLLPGDKGVVSYNLEEGLYRSYTGVWFWAPFRLENGNLSEYDSSWINQEYSSETEAATMHWDGQYAASYSKNDLFKRNGELYLTFTFCGYYVYETWDILALQPGDTYSFYDGEIVIENIVINPWDNDGQEMYDVWINDDSVGLMSVPGDPNVMMEIEPFGDGYPRYFDIDTITLKINHNACLYDKSCNPDPFMNAKVISYEDLLAYFAEDYYGGSPRSTTITVENNEIVSINHEWMP